MAQHDYVIDNSTGQNVRQDINNALQAIVTNNSGSSAPSATFPFMLFADSAAGTMKIRNAADNAFIELFQLDGTFTLEDGSASTPALAFRDDLNTGIFSSAADTFNVATGGVERMELGTTTIFNEDGADVDFRIEGDTEANLFYVDAGNDQVGIGTSSPTALFNARTASVALASNGHVYIQSTDSGADIGGQLNFGNNNARRCAIAGRQEGSDAIAGYLQFGTRGPAGTSNDIIERMRIDSSGRVGIGATSFNDAAEYLLVNNSSTACNVSIIGANDAHSTLNLGDEDDFNIQKIKSDHTNNSLQFFTNDSESMRIDSDGRVLIGATSPLYSEFLSVQKGGSSVNCAVFYFTNTQDNTAVSIRHQRAGHQGDGTNATMLNFVDKQNTVSGSITSNGSTTSYNESSDYRLKENEIAMSDGITRLKTLKPYRFNFKVDTTRTVDGFFAHEVQSVVPEAVAGEKDALDKDGNINPQQLDKSKLVPLLVAAVQELIGKVEALEAA